MNNTEKMVALMREIKPEMNGAVVEDMTNRGINYPLSYGVNIPTLRAIATKFAPDNDFARFLYRQQIRELQLAAFMIADPAQQSIEDMDYWAEGLTTIELAENFASTLLCRTPFAEKIICEWTQLSQNKSILHTPQLQIYAALIATIKLRSTLDRQVVSEIITQHHNNPNSLIQTAIENIVIAYDLEA